MHIDVDFRCTSSSNKTLTIKIPVMAAVQCSIKKSLKVIDQMFVLQIAHCNKQNFRIQYSNITEVICGSCTLFHTLSAIEDGAEVFRSTLLMN